eukprot:364710-Amphidinium_carterae.1
MHKGRNEGTQTTKKSNKQIIAPIALSKTASYADTTGKPRECQLHMKIKRHRKQELCDCSIEPAPPPRVASVGTQDVNIVKDTTVLDALVADLQYNEKQVLKLGTQWEQDRLNVVVSHKAAEIVPITLSKCHQDQLSLRLFLTALL